MICRADEGLQLILSRLDFD